MSKSEKLTIYLSSGQTVEVEYDIEEYDEIYENWISHIGQMLFNNGSFMAKDVIGITWKLPDGY